ncbi:MAG: hypothetical protein HOM58_23710 [Rhodospirillaceae bacterium]|jgi:hypothetical protein|nr:hypothetical protein [Rhodospirillaceae bacterium]
MVKRSDKTNKRPRAVMIHGLTHARAACIAAREVGVPLELHSAPDAVASLGPLWFQKILEEIDAEFPDLDIEMVLDCGDAAGYALAALRQGLKHIRFSGPKITTEKIRDMARQQKAVLHKGWPDILDLGHEADPANACRHWFENSP